MTIISDRRVSLRSFICVTQQQVNRPHSSVTFAVVTKVSGSQACLELTVWYTQELTLTGHGQVIVKPPRYFGLQAIRLTGRPNTLPDVRSLNVDQSRQEFGAF